MTSLQASIRNTSDSSATDIRKGKEIQQSLSIPLGPTQERLKRERESGYTQDQINGTTRDYKKQETFTNKVIFDKKTKIKPKNVFNGELLKRYKWFLLV